jgi:hypothetical protein
MQPSAETSEGRFRKLFNTLNRDFHSMIFFRQL